MNNDPLQPQPVVPAPQPVQPIQPLQSVPVQPVASQPLQPLTPPPLAQPIAAQPQINQVAAQPVKQVDTSKGFWKWVLKFLNFTGVTARVQADMEVAQNYAMAHGYTFEQYVQLIPTAADGLGSVILAAENPGIFNFHIKGQLSGMAFDSFIYHARGRDLKEHQMIQVVDHNNHNVMLTVLVGRITIKESRPSTIIHSLTSMVGINTERLTGAVDVKLEGDFNKYFTTYGPSIDPVSTFQTMPPNFMATLIDQYAGTTIEIAGSSIYLFQVTKETGIDGGPGLAFTEADLDTMTARLTQLAGFFALGLAATGAPQPTGEILTNKEFLLNKIADDLTKPTQK